ncbi:MAG: biotin--[acetyl-CoA-carboxylase] ligase [Candidatus Aenigmatarchaeota archaeon]
MDSIDSTNNYAYKLAQEGAREITVIKANFQSQGKGRFGRFWESPKNKGIYASFILRPSNSISDIYYLPPFFSLAVVKTIKEFVPAKIKLPNDVVVRDKKIAGVLVEAKSFGETVDFVIAGIGVNINTIKKELPQDATSLFLETDKFYDIEHLFKELIKEVVLIYSEFKKNNIRNLLEEFFSYQENKYANIKDLLLKKEAVILR